MTPTPKYGTPDGDASLAIQKLARASGGDVQEIQTLYVLEALLARIAASDYREDFVLKGGVLLAAFAARRPTRDIDLQASGVSNDADDVAKRLRAIAAIELQDGVVFDQSSVVASSIRDTDSDEYPGVRVRLIGRLGRARLTVGVDVNFGDPIWPKPETITLPRIVQLGHPPLKLLGYPLTMVLAEKIVTAIDRGESNTRWRDFADIYTLTRSQSVVAEVLRDSLDAVASYRSVSLAPLLPTLSDMPDRAQSKWRAWRTRVNRQEELPASFTEILNEVARFSDPVLMGTAKGNWNIAKLDWQEPQI